MTTHELARQLLEMDDIPVVHHFHHQDGFEDNPWDYYSNVNIFVQDGCVYLSEGDRLDTVEDTSWEEA